MQRTRRHVRLVPLVAVLVWAVALMHSVPARAEGGDRVAAAMAGGHFSCCPAPSLAGQLRSGGAGGDQMPGHGSHDVAHLCLAVLTALIAVVLGVGLYLSFRARSLAIVDARPGERLAVARPPPPAGAVLLTSLCVLRV